MSRRNWKRVQPRDLRDALDLCTEYAREKYNRSVDNISDEMGLSSKFTLYKWISDCSMPIRLVRPFENACGIDFVSRWGVISTGKLVIDVPKGRKGTPEDIQTLLAVTHESNGAVMQFYDNKISMEEALSAIQTALENTAWHKVNIEKYRQPELPFDED